MSESQITVNVLLFAKAAEIVGSRNLSVTIQDGSTIAQMADKLVVGNPSLEALVRVSRWAVKNAAIENEFQETSFSLADADEVAMIPPVSGG